MKKHLMTITILLGMATMAFADPNDNHHGGLFQRGAEPRDYANSRDANAPMLPIHGQNESQDASPLGSGIAVLLGLGAAYLVGKKGRKE